MVIPWGLHGDGVPVTQAGAGKMSLMCISSGSLVGKGRTIDTHFLHCGLPNTIAEKKANCVSLWLQPLFPGRLNASELFYLTSRPHFASHELYECSRAQRCKDSNNHTRLSAIVMGAVVGSDRSTMHVACVNPRRIGTPGCLIILPL